MPVRCPIGSDVSHAANILCSGGIVAFATETVYGLGANALNTAAVARVFEAKQRPHFDPLIVHVADEGWLDRLTHSVRAEAFELVSHFWPGPLTLVLPKVDIVPDLVTAGLPSVAVRIPGHPQALELLRECDLAIAAPSANPFGCVSPTTAEHVAEQLGDKIDYILDGGECRVGIESTVLQLTDTGPVLLRPGGVTVEAIEALIGPVGMPGDDKHSTAQVAPGMLPRHYAPRTRLTVVEQLERFDRPGRWGLLSLLPPPRGAHFCAMEILSEKEDLPEAAAGFFAALRRLDALELDGIIAVAFPNVGLGRALNDRLRRASEDGAEG